MQIGRRKCPVESGTGRRLRTALCIAARCSVLQRGLGWQETRLSGAGEGGGGERRSDEGDDRLPRCCSVAERVQ